MCPEIYSLVRLCFTKMSPRCSGSALCCSWAKPGLGGSLVCPGVTGGTLTLKGIPDLLAVGGIWLNVWCVSFSPSGPGAGSSIPTSPQFLCPPAVPAPLLSLSVAPFLQMCWSTSTLPSCYAVFPLTVPRAGPSPWMPP